MKKLLIIMVLLISARQINASENNSLSKDFESKVNGWINEREEDEYYENKGLGEIDPLLGHLQMLELMGNV